MKVIFKKHFSNDDEFHDVGSVSLINGELIWSVDTEPKIKDLMCEGVIADTIDGQRKVTPDEEPEEFIKALPRNFNYTYFVAVPVEEDNINKAMDFPKPDVRSLPGELENQVSAPEKVDGVEEQRKHTPQRDNMESYYEKSVINDWFYSLGSNTTKNTILADLKMNLISKGIFNDSKFAKISEAVRKNDTLFSLKKALDIIM